MSEFIRKLRLHETRFSFGATAAIITNMALIAGLRTGEHAKVSIVGGMLIIAIADNISDSVGIHVYQESECLEPREVWLSTFTNFFARLLVSLTFVLLIAFLPIKSAVICSLAWGLSLLAYISYRIAKDRNLNPYAAMLEHISIALAVTLASNFAGGWLMNKFKF